MTTGQEMLTVFEKSVSDWEETVREARARGDDDVAGLALAVANVSRVVLEWNRPEVEGTFTLGILDMHKASIEIMDAIEQGLRHIKENHGR